MNQEIKKQWVEALRSGKYKQGRSKLRPTENTFCCLGVLCDIVEPKGWHGVDGHIWHNCQETGPGDFVCNKAEINNPHLVNLVELNDKDLASFNKIADYIERVL